MHALCKALVHGYVSVSDNNNQFTEIKTITNYVSKDTPGTIFENFGWQGSVDARYIRYQAFANGMKGGWVFIDEIVVW